MRATAVRCCCDRVHTARTSCPACACVATQWQLVSAHELGDELCLVSESGPQASNVFSFTQCSRLLHPFSHHSFACVQEAL